MPSPRCAFSPRQPQGLAHARCAEAHDFAAWTPDPELAASYRRLAGSYHALARLRDQISAGGDRELRDGPK